MGRKILFVLMINPMVLGSLCTLLNYLNILRIEQIIFWIAIPIMMIGFLGLGWEAGQNE